MSNYRNRIKALEFVSSADLVSHPGNWRDHPKAQAEALKGVLAEVGIAGALLAYRSERQGGHWSSLTAISARTPRRKSGRCLSSTWTTRKPITSWRRMTRWRQWPRPTPGRSTRC